VPFRGCTLWTSGDEATAFLTDRTLLSGALASVRAAIDAAYGRARDLRGEIWLAELRRRFGKTTHPAAVELALRVSATMGGPLRGTCRVPGDKSISHRALLFGALTDGKVDIDGLGLGGDNVSTARALEALGVRITLDGARAQVQGVGIEGLRESAAPLDCG